MIKPEARRILVVDDTPAIHVDFHKILRGGLSDPHSLNATRDLLFGEVSSRTDICWDVDSSHQGDEGVEKVRKSLDEGKPYSVAFVDMRMPPGPNGLETTKKIWQLDPEILVVLCTAYTDFTWNEIVAQLGTSDRLLILKKPFESIEVRQMALALSERWSVARTDPLTQVLNRRSWLEHSRRWWLRSNPGESLSCIMLDLDHFKRLNDSYGHQAGDSVLVATADLLRRTVRPQDVVARYGGEEFCILMPGASEAVAAEWAAQLRSELRNTSVPFGSLSLKVTISIGVAERTNSTSTATHLMEAADKALYVAKRSGRDRVVAHSMLNGIDLRRLDAQCGPYVELSGLNAQDIMTQPVCTLSHRASLKQAAKLMLESRVNTMVIVDENEHLAGMLSEADALQAAMLTSDWATQVKDIMQTNVVHCDATDRAEDVAATVMREPHRKVVVTRQQRPVGTLARTNFDRWLASQKDKQVRCDPAVQPPRNPSPAEHLVVELLHELQTDCGEFLKAVRGDQAQFAAPVIQQVYKFQEQLTDAIAKQHLAAHDQSIGV